MTDRPDTVVKPEPPSKVQRWIGRIMLVSGVLTFAFMLHSADLEGSLRILSATGPILIVGIFPYLAQIGFDALAWRTLLEGLGKRVRWRRLVAIRLSTEAVLMSMPAGTFIGETLKPYLLHKTDAVPAAETIASIGVKKALLTFAEAVYLSTALIVGWALVREVSSDLVGSGALPMFIVGAILLLLVVATLLSIAFMGGKSADFVHRLLMKMPVKAFRDWIEDRRAPFDATDGAFKKLGTASRARIGAAFASLVAAWFVETGETWVLLSLLGIHLPIVDVLVMEACVVFMRNLAFFVPAGLGVQDAGYIAFLRAFAIPNASAASAAFVIVKRAKELLWVAIGYGCLFVLQTRVRPVPTTTATVLLTESA